MDLIIKLLEEDEDETMYSEADVLAVTAELNRDLVGSLSASQTTGSNAVTSHGMDHSQWQCSGQDVNAKQPSQLGPSIYEQGDSVSRKQKQHLPGFDSQQHNQGFPCSREVGPPLQPKQEDANKQHIHQSSKPSQLQVLENNAQHVRETGITLIHHREAQFSKLQPTNQQTTTSKHGGKAVNKDKQIPFALMLPLITPHLDKERTKQLESLFLKLKKHEIPRDRFVRLMRTIVGDQLIKMGAIKLQSQERVRNYQRAANQYQLPAQGTSQQQFLGMPSANAPIYSQSFAQAHQQDSKSPGDPSKKVFSAEHVQAITQKTQSAQQKPIDRINEQKQRPLSATAHGISCGQIKSGTALITTKEDVSDKETGVIGFQASTSSSCSAIPAWSAQKDSQETIPQISEVQLAGNIGGDVPKKAIIGKKNALETSSPPSFSSKKQKVSGSFMDQTIMQVNDVAAISGVNLREEEEHLFSGSKEDSQVSEATRRVVQEEEKKLIFKRVPLLKKLKAIMLRCGVRSMGKNVVRCLSLCAEERMLDLLRNTIRLSKQRVDTNKMKHWTIVTSDVCQQILFMNRKSKEERENKQAEIERLQKLNEPVSYPATDCEKEREQGWGKAHKTSKEDRDETKTVAANVAARAAVGGDDMTSKWQKKADKVSHGGSASSSHTSLPRRCPNENQDDAVKTDISAAPGSAGEVGTKVERRISVKDVLAVLEREPQVSESTLIYHLLNKVHIACSYSFQDKAL